MTDPASADGASAEELGTEQGRRIIQLLWEPSATAVPSRGPKPKITLDDVIDAGVAMADADGLANLSMRKVAGRLGVGAMSLYTYVPGRDELLELMVNRVHAELAPAARELPADELSWRADVEHQVRRALADVRAASLAAGPERCPSHRSVRTSSTPTRPSTPPCTGPACAAPRSSPPAT